MSHAETIVERIAADGVKVFDLRFTDLAGRWRHLGRDAAGLEAEILEAGVLIDGSAVPGWREVNEADLLLRPDLDSAWLDPFSAQPTLVVVCDACDPASGLGYERCPRSAAQRALAHLAAAKVADDASVAVDIGFFLFDEVRVQAGPWGAGYDLVPTPTRAVGAGRVGGHGALRGRPPVEAPFLALPPADPFADLRAEIASILAGLGVGGVAHGHGRAPLQAEFALGAASLTRAADRVQAFKYVTHMVAASYGKAASFLAKPLADQPGSALRIHQSLWRANRPAFAGHFPGGARLVVETMLQSPHFLFRMEETTNPKWAPYARASRLSYALWDTMPNDALLQSAARGELNTPASLEKVARRMLDNPKAKQALDEFIAQWMRFDRVLTSTKDRRRFPQYTRETAIAMTEETRRFMSDLVWGDENFTELFTANYGYLNADLAAVYKMPAPATEFTKVTFPPESERAGLLGQALFLSLTSKPDDTSPTARGLFVREQFLCQKVADPPPGVNTNLPPISAAKPQTNRDRLAEHTTNKSCSGCHSLVDPIGFGLEKFDAIGGRRDKLPLVFFGDRRNRDTPPKTVQLDLDTSGFVAGIQDSKFTSPKELGAVLGRSAVCQECIVKQYFRYTVGRTETPADRALIKALTDDFRKSGFRFKELIISMVRAREFAADGGAVHVANNH